MSQSAKWVIDPSHSEVQFKIKHLVISSLTGFFKSYEGSLTTENGDFADAKAEFSIDVASLDTTQESRDKHVVGPDFFDVANFPKILFKSTSFKKVDEENYTMTGDLTIRGVTKSEKLKVLFGGEAVDNYGNAKAGFEVSGTVNRKDYGLTWNGITEAGSVIVGPEIKLLINTQVIKKA
jgi:polyisoprenoid-binding protein YceI